MNPSEGARNFALMKLLAGTALVLGQVAGVSIAGASAAEPSDQARTHFLIVGKARVADPKEQQQRGIDAVRKVGQAARAIQPDALVESLAEQVMTVEQYRRGEAAETVSGKVFKERLKRLIATARPQDTVVIYTHSHGLRNGFEPSQPLGGIVMDLPVRKPEHGGALLWDEYADLLLQIPAKNVVVLTMSCFSGGLVDYLNSPPVLRRWKDRREQEGRNLVLLTSQNERLTSGPILINREVINPFTHAVAAALAGQADGFALADGKPAASGVKDGQLSVGEVVDFILHTTEHTKSDAPRQANTAQPKVTGSFNRADILFARVAGRARGDATSKPSR